MYEVKPIFDQSKVHVDLPNCMYKVKSIYDSSTKSSLSNGLTGAAAAANSNDGELVLLKKRQSEVVKQLEQLRLKLNEMEKKLGVTATSNQKNSTSSKSINTRPIDVKNLEDIVIHANPNNIPYSLLALQTLLTNRLNLLIECYTHSSIIELPAKNRTFANCVKSFKSNTNVPTLKVIIIWKATSSIQLICATGSFIPISGEVNIIRYLVRIIGSSEFGYADDTNIKENLEIDAVCDLTHELLTTPSKDYRATILKRISQRLGTKSMFGHQSTNFSDIVVLSALKQLNLNAKELPNNMKTWQEKNKTILTA